MSKRRLHTRIMLAGRAFASCACVLLLPGCCEIAYGPARCRLQAAAAAPASEAAPSCAASAPLDAPPALMPSAPPPRHVQAPFTMPHSPHKPDLRPGLADNWLHL